MTPTEIYELDDDTLTAFVRFMQREAAEVAKGSRAGR